MTIRDPLRCVAPLCVPRERRRRWRAVAPPPPHANARRRLALSPRTPPLCVDVRVCNRFLTRFPFALRAHGVFGVSPLGDGKSCRDCLGHVFGDAAYDECGVCNGDNLSCADCTGKPHGTVRFDACGVCGGDGTSCIEGGCSKNCMNLARCMFSFLFNSHGKPIVPGGLPPTACKNC